MSSWVQQIASVTDQSQHYVPAGELGTPPLARRPAPAALVSPVVGLVIGQQVHGVSPAMQRAQDEAEIRTLTAQVSELVRRVAGFPSQDKACIH